MTHRSAGTLPSPLHRNMSFTEEILLRWAQSIPSNDTVCVCVGGAGTEGRVGSGRARGRVNSSQIMAKNVPCLLSYLSPFPVAM